MREIRLFHVRRMARLGWRSLVLLILQAGCGKEPRNPRYDALLESGFMVRGDSIRTMGPDEQVRLWLYAHTHFHPALRHMSEELTATPADLLHSLVALLDTPTADEWGELVMDFGTWLLCRSDLVSRDSLDVRVFQRWVEGLEPTGSIERRTLEQAKSVLGGACRCRYPDIETCWPGVVLVP